MSYLLTLARCGLPGHWNPWCLRVSFDLPKSLDRTDTPTPVREHMRVTLSGSLGQAERTKPAHSHEGRIGEAIVTEAHTGHWRAWLILRVEVRPDNVKAVARDVVGTRYRSNIPRSLKTRTRQDAQGR